MLISLVRMPPVFGVPLDRRFYVTLEGNSTRSVEGNHAIWPSRPLSRSNFETGSHIERAPSHPFKTIHVSQNRRYVFETVFSVEPSASVCLYTKIIEAGGSLIGISLPAIHHYQSSQKDIKPTMYSVIPNHAHSITDNVVPPVFGSDALWAYINRLIDARASRGMDMRLGWAYAPIYDHIPVVYDALVHGCYSRQPFTEIPVSYPMVEIKPDKWFNYHEIAFSQEARGLEAYRNDSRFDSIALAMMLLGPTKFSMTSSITNAFDGHVNLWVTNDFQDTYRPILFGALNGTKLFTDSLIQIFHHAVRLYCNIYQISPGVFYQNELLTESAQSSVTLSKNIYDEISITFHDLIHDRYVCFYTSFPAIALATLSAGSG